jgi:RNA polymerase sigma-70 factor (ECF subfamily)
MKSSYIASINEDSDGALVAAAKCGDSEAFEQLFLRHKQRAFSVAQRITNNREDAEDAAQESFHKAFLHLHTFQEKSSFSTWLTRIAMNQAFMLLRRRRAAYEVLPESPDDSGKSASEVFVDQRPNPEESCWRRESAELLTKAINRLGPKIRTTIFLREIEERSAQETAALLHTTTSVVKGRTFDGRRKLRRMINHAIRWGISRKGTSNYPIG